MQSLKLPRNGNGYTIVPFITTFKNKLIQAFKPLHWTLGFLLFFASAGQAYDIDSHFYATAAILMKRGVKKEVALKIAAYAQWIDESAITTPMRFERPRRIFHMPMPLMTTEIPKPDPQEISKILSLVADGGVLVPLDEVTPLDSLVSFSDRIHGKNIGVLSEVIENNPMAYDILKKGFATGDFVLVGAGIHILMDSFGHSGFTAALGHATSGHDPDAPYRHVEKYYRMLKVVFDLTTVLIKALPPEALDFKAMIRTSDGRVIGAIEASSADVLNSFISDPLVKNAIEQDIRRSEDYTLVATTQILTSLYQAGAIRDLNKVVELANAPFLFTSHETTEEIMTRIITEIIKLEFQGIEVVNLPTLQDRYLKSISMNLSIQQFVATHGGIGEAAKAISKLITYRFIAHDVNSSQQNVLDPDGVPRQVEMLMRISNWQDVIEHLTGERIKFDKGPDLKTYVFRMMRERFKSKAKAPNITDFVPLPEEEMGLLEAGIQGIEVGVNFREQLAWNWKMFNIVYIDLIRYVGISWKFNWNDFKSAQGKDKLSYLASVMGWNFLESRPGSHNVIDPQVYLLQNEEAFEQALNEGVLKQIIKPSQVVVLKDQYQRKHAEFQLAGPMICRSILRRK